MVWLELSESAFCLAFIYMDYAAKQQKTAVFSSGRWYTVSELAARANKSMFEARTRWEQKFRDGS